MISLGAGGREVRGQGLAGVELARLASWLSAAGDEFSLCGSFHTGADPICGALLTSTTPRRPPWSTLAPWERISADEECQPDPCVAAVCLCFDKAAEALKTQHPGRVTAQSPRPARHRCLSPARNPLEPGHWDAWPQLLLTRKGPPCHRRLSTCAAVSWVLFSLVSPAHH